MNYRAAESSGFEHLDQHQARSLAPHPGEMSLYGGVCVISDTVILETPESLRLKGWILTNPSQIETEIIDIRGEKVPVLTLWARVEPASGHLGKTVARKYISHQGSDGKRVLIEYAESAELRGEDPRRTQANMPGHLGVHRGELLSVIEATPVPGEPDRVQGIQQLFYWAPAQSPTKPELVAIGPPGAKNNNPFALHLPDDQETEMGVITRPHPTLGYCQVSDPTKITPEVIGNAQVIHGLVPTDAPIAYHVGGNLAELVGKDRVRIRGHQAWKEPIQDGLRLHYRLADHGAKIERGRIARVVFLGVTATRDQFPAAPPKPAEGDVADYDPIVFGAVNGHVSVGVGDNHLAYGKTTYYK